MTKFEITGNKKLSGNVKIAGNKNSVLPIMAACLLTDQACFLENVPEISDVDVMAKLLELAGVVVQKQQKGKLKITAKDPKGAIFPKELTENILNQKNC